MEYRDAAPSVNRSSPNTVNDGPLTFSASMGGQCFNIISITDDDEVEEDELFQLTLSGVSRTTGNTTAYQLNISTATITIIDDDCKFVFMYSRASYTSQTISQ